MKVSDYVINFFEEKGVKDMFFVAGGGCMHLLDSLGNSKINDIALLHEQSVAIATESYAFAGNTVGVGLVTTGPGGTNTVTGVLSAYVDSIPCVFLSGQVKTTDLKRNFGVRAHGSQEADIVSIVKDITKYSVMIENKDELRFHLEKAWYEATTGRKGPVWIDIPLDIQGTQIEEENLYGFLAPEEPISAYKNRIHQIIELIQEAKRPIILAGNGLRGYEKDFYEFLEKTKIPVIPSWKAVDMIANDHPLFAGKCGTLGERGANFAMQTSDLIISLGCRLDFSITGFDRSKWAVDAKKIIVDIDEAEIDKLNTNIDFKVVADVGEFLEYINSLDFTVNGFEKWKNKIKQWLLKYPVGKDIVESNQISTYELVAEICSQLKNDAVIVPASAGTTAEIVGQAINIKMGQKVRSNHGLGSMGYEIPASIGACIATNNEVIVFAGDGGMQLNIQELAIISGRKLPIKIFVVNNSGYSSIRNMQRNHFDGRYVGSNFDTGLFLPNMTDLAKAYGITGYEIEKKEDLKAIIKKTLETNGPVICDVAIDQMCVVAPKSTAKILEDGSIVSSPLEDMFPFLDEEDLKNELDVSDI